MKNRPIDRREFFGKVGRGAAVAAAGLALPYGLVRAAPGKLPANERIGLGFIGVGSQGGGHLRWVIDRPEYEILAISDVDAEHAGQAAERTGGKATVYKDYRALLDRKDIDAVLIATPDHWHALTVIDACKAGKDIYCEKPLALTIAEGRAMVDAVRRYGRVFQVGSQQRSDMRFRWAVELVRNGRIGRIERVRAVLPRGPTCEWEPDEAPPEHLDWDFWLGPAPAVPYTPRRCHWNFRWFYDYSGGQVTDWGAHHNDIAQWGLGTELTGPREVEGKATFPTDGLYETAVDFDIHYRYASGITLHTTSKGTNGVTFYGTDGSIFVSRSTITADPPEILDTPPGAGPIPVYESNDHHGNWIDCMRTRRLPICDIEIGHRSVSTAHIGNIAIRLGRKLQWDPDHERFLNDADANRLLSKPMRNPWRL